MYGRNKTAAGQIIDVKMKNVTVISSVFLPEVTLAATCIKKTPVRGHFAEVGTFARQMDRSDFNSHISPSTFPPSDRKSFQLVLKIVLDPFQTINQGATAASHLKSSRSSRRRHEESN